MHEVQEWESGLGRMAYTIQGIKPPIARRGNWTPGSQEHADFTEALSSLPVSSHSQPAPGDPAPSSGLCRHLHSCTRIHT